MTRSLPFAIGALALLAAPAAHAWGPYGHAIVADIAQARLTPQAAQLSRTLLAQEGHQTLDQVASWPDTIGHVPKAHGGAPETLVWHYVDTDVKSPTYDAARDCPQDLCVTQKLPEMERILADANAPAEKRLVALKWVVHLVGDIHQPLHAAERDHDKGGNMVRLTYFGNNANGHMNLHSLWDEGILDHEAGLVVGPHYSIDFDKARAEAQILNAQISEAQAQAWSGNFNLADAQTATTAWTDESHTLARSVAYGLLPNPKGGALGADYTAAAWPVVQTRLEQAGVRLAAVLNAALAAPVAAPAMAR